MFNRNFSGIILLPHDTPLSRILGQHREIMGRLAQVLGKGKIYPVCPSHCHIAADRPVNELKRSISHCRILPPAFKNGFLYRPVEIDGARLKPFPSPLFRHLLPSTTETEKSTEAFPENVPTGFIFGYIKAAPFDGTETEGIPDEFGRIETLQLRVFRLHEIQYRWHQQHPGKSSWKSSLKRPGENPEEANAPQAIYWTMGPPHWVKTCPPGRRPPSRRS